MIFEPAGVDGAYLIRPERVEDERGFFARTFCEDEFKAQGLETRFVQCSVSFNRRRGTLRGMHWQDRPCEETKIVRCTMGAVHDVVIDLRPGSPSYMRHAAACLSAGNRAMFYLPAGCAHGFVTLEDDTELLYRISSFYVPEAARGVRWDDPAFAIDWPEPVRVISDRDRSYPDFEE